MSAKALDDPAPNDGRRLTFVSASAARQTLRFANQVSDLLPILRGPLFGVLLMGGRCMEFDVFPQFRFGLGHERRRTGFHSRVFLTTI